MYSLKKQTLVSAVSLTVILAGCAKRPDAIVPVDIPIAAYTNLTCEDLSHELIAERNVLAALSKKQKQAATGDAVGVFLLGVPLSSAAGGDKEGEIAVSKGKVLSLENTIRSKSCNTQS